MSTVKELVGLMQVHADLGIEVEIEGNWPEVSSSLWRLKGDGSIGNGIEYCSIPLRVEQLSRALKWLRVYMRRTHQYVTDRCGVHIHINVQELTFTELMNYIVLYYVYEPLLISAMASPRQANMFCLKAEDASATISQLAAAAKAYDIFLLPRYKYSALNVSSVFNWGTLEFRALQSTKNTDVIEQWIGLLLSMRNMAKEFASPRDIIEAPSANGVIEFTHMLFGDAILPFLKGKNEQDIRTLIMRGVRTIQPVAYVFNTSPPKVEDVEDRVFTQPLQRELRYVFRGDEVLTRTFTATSNFALRDTTT